MRVPRAVVRAVARVKPAVPDAAWPVIATLRSFVGDGPIVATPAFRRALALAAHPDDESVGCGGLLLQLADSGADVHVCFATDGEATIGADLSVDEVRRRRRDEARRACRLLGTTEPRFLGHPDGRLRDRVDVLARDIATVVDELRPDVVLAPWRLDGHPDHQAVADALDAAGLAPTVERWGYETWTPLVPNRLVDITSVFERKEAALACYKTAHLAFDVGAMLAINRYRSVHGLSGRGYAEAYLAEPRP